MLANSQEKIVKIAEVFAYARVLSREQAHNLVAIADNTKVLLYPKLT
ncbi:hypothetical protein [Nostoc sp. PCC 7107]|nr:hypothetical protein [Nostoc sp. PCC 7107]